MLRETNSVIQPPLLAKTMRQSNLGMGLPFTHTSCKLGRRQGAPDPLLISERKRTMTKDHLAVLNGQVCDDSICLTHVVIHTTGLPSRYRRAVPSRFTFRIRR